MDFTGCVESIRGKVRQEVSEEARKRSDSTST